MNHLMVGLGGTGGKVIAAMRRLVYQRNRKLEPAELSLNYLYVDTSSQDVTVANIMAPLKVGDRMWRTLGHSVQLDPLQIVHLEQGNFAHILSNPEDYPNFRSWLGDIETWRRIWNAAPNGIEAGGQLRRFGRYLLAQNLDALRKGLINGLNPRQAGGFADADWTVHVIAGLAGGTGSGTLLDVLGQVRTIAAGARAKLVAYVVLPETEDTTWAKENYYANGYAALAELNGFIVNRFQPTNPAATEVYASEIPVNNTFVITNRNENGLIVDVDRVLPNIIAETLYQIIIASGDARALGARAAAGAGVAGGDERVWRDMVTGENYFGGYEKDTPDGPDERANRFLSFGVKRVAIPHQEVREYSAMVFMRQFLLQSLNNQWNDAEGFTESRKPFDGAAVARSDDNRQKWLLTTPHLMLEAHSLENDKGWRGLGDEFRNALNGKTKSIISSIKNKNEWPRELETFALDFFERSFRRVGVSEFYKVAERSVIDRARLIVRDRVASDLFQSWRAGIWSLRDIVRIVDELIADVKDRMIDADAKVQRHANVESTKEAQRKQQVAEYLNDGFIRRNVFHPRTQRLPQLSATLAELYTERAAKIATGYMKRTLAAVLAQLQDLKSETETVSARFDLALGIVGQRLADRVKPESGAPAESHLYKLFDPVHVQDLLRRLEQVKSLQESQVASLRDCLVKELAVNATFAGFAELNEARIVEAIEGEAESRAETALGAMEAERDRILEASVIQKLYDEYSGRDEELRRFIAERVREAGTFAAFSPQQAALGRADVARAVVAFVPAAEELHERLREFRNKLVTFIRGAGNGATVSVVDTRDLGHEIVFLSLTNQFPLRYLSALEFLKKRYDALVNGRQAKRKRLELHVEHDGKLLPELYPIGIEEVRRQMRPHWLLAEMAGQLIERKNPRTGQPETIIKVVNEDGEIRTPVVGRTIADGTKSLDHPGAAELRHAVDAYLKALVHVDDRKALVDQFIKRKNDALERAKFDESDPAYAKIGEDVAAARAMIEAQQA